MKNRLILVVEDSPTHMRFITEALKSEGYSRIITAANGEDALLKAAEQKPHLMILDVILPGKNGYQVCRQIRNSPETHNIRVLMLTSKDQDSDRFWGMKQGADVYLTKPCERADLLKHVEKLMET
ncbi:MAG: response regulator [Desulfobacterales bacterium]